MEGWYDPTEGDVGERDRLWNDLNRAVDRVGNRYRLCALSDLNGWDGDLEGLFFRI